VKNTALKGRTTAAKGFGEAESSRDPTTEVIARGDAFHLSIRSALEEIMNSMSDRFRNWYDHECDCNAKLLTMLRSIPEVRHSAPEFRRALDLAAHLIMARRMWLFRLGEWKENPGGWEKNVQLADLPKLFADTEQAWVNYLLGIEDGTISKDLEWKGWDEKYRRWPIENILYQVSCHAWYHRGQIVELVKMLGGETTSTDYIFWNQPTIIPAP
jgi:uncharacterized damage-inducible protein DinB